MKIAIMTQPLGRNYGGIMQAWALQQVLKRMGHDPVTIDRQQTSKGPAYHAARLGYRTLQKALGKRKAPINFERHLPNILQNTYTFIDQNIKMSESLDSTAKLKTHFERGQYDAVIVGSDQTWRPRYSPNIGNFFLDFLENSDIKKITYASSFGVDEWEFTEEQALMCSSLAKKFNAISVREDTGIQLCHKHLGVDALHVLDPTLLLNKNEYINLIGDQRFVASNKKTVFTYFLDKTSQKQSIAKYVSNELGITLHSCQAKTPLSVNVPYRLEDFEMPDPRDWLAGFANAEFVVTDSFHGMVFSIVFNKPFIAVGNSERGMSRFSSLLNFLELENRLFIDRFEEEQVLNIISSPINWEKINKNLNTAKANSNLFLTEALC